MKSAPPMLSSSSDSIFYDVIDIVTIIMDTLLGREPVNGGNRSIIMPIKDGDE
jgi:hypothetical protein